MKHTINFKDSYSKIDLKNYYNKDPVRDCIARVLIQNIDAIRNPVLFNIHPAFCIKTSFFKISLKAAWKTLETI